MIPSATLGVILSTADLVILSVAKDPNQSKITVMSKMGLLRKLIKPSLNGLGIFLMLIAYLTVQLPSSDALLRSA